MKLFQGLLIFATFAIVNLVCSAMAQQPQKQSDNWLLEAKDDTERFKRVQQMFGGFSASMQVVGERYEKTYDAVAEGNFDLANYHWKKIKEAIELGYFRRPAREANSVALFLKGPWPSTAEAITSKDKEKAQNAFLSAHSACMACHMAENVPFMNKQPLFRKTNSFSKQ
jgi:hypothetical protein